MVKSKEIIKTTEQIENSNLIQYYYQKCFRSSNFSSKRFHLLFLALCYGLQIARTTKGNEPHRVLISILFEINVFLHLAKLEERMEN